MLNVYSRTRDGETLLSRSFRAKEFACKDGTDPLFVDSELVQVLQAIRDHFGAPVVITSGYRTAAPVSYTHLQREVHDAVLTAEGHCGFCRFLCQRVQARATSTGKDHCHNFFCHSFILPFNINISVVRK